MEEMTFRYAVAGTGTLLMLCVTYAWFCYEAKRTGTPLNHLNVFRLLLYAICIGTLCILIVYGLNSVLSLSKGLKILLYGSIFLAGHISFGLLVRRGRTKQERDDRDETPKIP